MKQHTRVLALASMLAVALIGLALAAGCSGAQTGSSPSPAPAVAPPASSTATTAPAPATSALSGVDLGKKIFTTGEDNAGVIPTKYGIAKIKVNACKNCHGVDAKGGKKMKLTAPDIRGSVLQPDFDQATFARSVTTGVDDTGKRLHKQMPRFTATPEDTAALWLYVNSLK